MYRKATAVGGGGNVVKAIITEEKSNMTELVRNYNNLRNEGGTGFIPRNEYFEALPGYKEWEVVTEVF